MLSVISFVIIEYRINCYAGKGPIRGNLEFHETNCRRLIRVREECQIKMNNDTINFNRQKVKGLTPQENISLLLNNNCKLIMNWKEGFHTQHAQTFLVCLQQCISPKYKKFLISETVANETCHNSCYWFSYLSISLESVSPETIVYFHNNACKQTILLFKEIQPCLKVYFINTLVKLYY